MSPSYYPSAGLPAPLQLLPGSASSSSGGSSSGSGQVLAPLASGGGSALYSGGTPSYLAGGYVPPASFASAAVSQLAPDLLPSYAPPPTAGAGMSMAAFAPQGSVLAGPPQRFP